MEFKVKWEQWKSINKNLEKSILLPDGSAKRTLVLLGVVKAAI